MIVNYFIPPHPALNLFIDNYILSTSNGERVTFQSLWPASNETNFIFHFADLPKHITDEQNKTGSLENKHNCIIGLSSNFNGIISFNGNYHRFIIQFKANGFYKIFRRPLPEFTNKIFGLDDVFGKPVKNLQEELANTNDVQKMAFYADAFLLTFLNRQPIHNNMHDGITVVSSCLFDTASLNIAQYAYKANMSIRNFERRFSEQIGISPKLYFRLARFNNAVITKLKCPQKNWTAIAHECGYYDQMHMIKDFTEFTELNPSHVLQTNKDFIRPRINTTGLNTATFFQLGSNLPYEEFVFVQRDNF